MLFGFVLEAHLDAFGAGLGGLSNVGFDWLSFDGFTLRIGFTVDSIALVMVAVVSLVALMVQVYSVSYMRHHGRPEPRYWWYFAAHSLFAGGHADAGAGRQLPCFSTSPGRGSGCAPSC